VEIRMPQPRVGLSVPQAVRNAFRTEPRLGPGFRLERIAVEKDGALALEGEVSTLAHKKLALLRAAAVPGVTRIVDRLVVAPGAPMSDREIRARLREAFAQDLDFSDLDLREDTASGVMATRYEPVAGPGGEARGRIDIEVEQGVVTLNGFAPTLVRKRLVGAVAWRVAGVRNVINGLVVRPDEQDSPDQIEEAVRVILDRDHSLDAAQIKVGVRGAVVRLTGLVNSNDQRDAAESDSWAVFGVDDVINEIEVRP
jgi:osmotically-inducible protein OsmY